ncbi:hypothetical protein [Pseudomonas fluorescens]|uniref:hypothetical protein n=1 Tax=Pseudomonas TaxID=286 RepID=UPI003CFC30A5
MQVLLLYTAIAFLIAGSSGLWRHKANLWAWVDCLYYPFAAIGIILLFHNSNGQRQAIEAIQNKELLQKELTLTLANQPRVHVDIDAELYKSYIALMETIPQLAAVCAKVSPTPACEAAKRLSPMIETFIKTASTGADRPMEKRLLSTCNAAESMLLEIEKSRVLPSTTTRELIGSYKALSQQNLGLGATYEVNRANEAIKSKSLAELQMLDQAVYSHYDTGAFVKEMESVQVNNATLILTGLTPCLATPNSELKQLNEWTDKKLTTQQRIQNFNQTIEKAKTSVDPRFYSFQLNLWPFVLVLALALKFGKGVAAVKPQCSIALGKFKAFWGRRLRTKQSAQDQDQA